MAAKLVERVARLDNDIASLRTKLHDKITLREQLLRALIEEGDVIRAETQPQRMVLGQAASYLATGRILTDEQVRDIRAAHRAGESQAQIGRRYGLSQPSIFKIVRRQSYRDVA